MKLKFEGFKITSQAFYKYFLILLPIFVWLTPISLFSILKRLDPRNITYENFNNWWIRVCRLKTRH